MTFSSIRAIRTAMLAAAILTPPAAGWAQQNGSPGLFDRMFNRDEGRPAAMAQADDSDLVVRLDRLENQIRQLTGSIEQLQYRNQQLEQTVKRMQDDTEFRFQELGGKGGAHVAAPPPRAPTPLAPAPAVPARRSDAAEPLPDNPGATMAPAEARAIPAGRGRNDAFDPAANPNAPGAPRALGSIASAGPAPMGIAGARPPASPPAIDRTAGPGIATQSLPPTRGDGGPQVAMVEPPSATPKDEYDLAYGYVLRKDYGLAEQTFRTFLRKYAGDRLVPDANYWLGESLFAQKHYREAAESFLAVTTKYQTSGKAPDSLLRLGQSLAALGEKEAACAALGEVGHKYPRASAGIKQGVDREQKRVHC